MIHRNVIQAAFLAIKLRRRFLPLRLAGPAAPEENFFFTIWLKSIGEVSLGNTSKLDAKHATNWP